MSDLLQKENERLEKENKLLKKENKLLGGERQSYRETSQFVSIIFRNILANLETGVTCEGCKGEAVSIKGAYCRPCNKLCYSSVCCSETCTKDYTKGATCSLCKGRAEIMKFDFKKML